MLHAWRISERVRAGDLERLRTDPPAEWLWRLGTAIGTTAVTIGLLLAGLILYAVLT